MTRRARERGSFSPLVAYGTMIVCVMGIGGATLGRIVDARREAQNVADAAALAAADTTRVNGIDANRSEALRLARLNSRAPTNTNITGITNRPKELDVSAGAAQSVDTPRFIFDGNAQVKTHARAKIDQEERRIGGATTADVAFVLDFSGSMADAIPGGTKITTLKNALTQYLNDRRIQLDYAAALFSDQLLGSVPFGAGAIQKILDLFKNTDAGGGTRPEFGFNKVTDYFGPPNTSGPPRFVVFVSDGAPNVPADAVAGSQHMWNTAHPEVMTIHIASPPIDPVERSFMVSVSGPPPNDCKKPPDQCPKKEDYYFLVSDIDSFKSALAQILGKIACPLDKLDGTRLKDPSTVNAFLRDKGGHEIKLPTLKSVDGSPDQLGFFFNPTSLDIAVTIEACALMRNEGRVLVVRYNRAVLVE